MVGKTVAVVGEAAGVSAHERLWRTAGAFAIIIGTIAGAAAGAPYWALFLVLVMGVAVLLPNRNGGA